MSVNPLNPLEKTSPFSAIRSAIKVIPLVATMIFGSIVPSQAAWFEKIIPAGETHTVRATDRDVAFLIDGYIYDARKFCYMVAGDRVVFFEGRYGLDYRATVYDLDSKERCELLLRERFYEE